jgi:hypothetical protein
MVHCLSISRVPRQRSLAAYAYPRLYGRNTRAERLGAAVAPGEDSASSAADRPTPQPRTLDE